MGIRNSSTIPKDHRARKTALRMALAKAGLSQAAWARSIGLTPGHVAQVVDGRRPGFGLDAKIADFIAKHLKDLKVAS